MSSAVEHGLTAGAWIVFAPLYIRAAWRDRNQDSPNGETARTESANQKGR